MFSMAKRQKKAAGMEAHFSHEPMVVSGLAYMLLSGQMLDCLRKKDGFKRIATPAWWGQLKLC